MARNELLLALALAIGVVAATAILPPVVDAQSEPGIAVERQSTAVGFEDVSGEGWEGVSASTVELSSAGADVPNADDVTVEEADVEAVRTDHQLFVRVSWDDPTQDASDDSVRAFADSVALQLPAEQGEESPPIAMGGSDDPVNIWQWSASGGAEELLAGGPGSTTSFDDPAVSTQQTYSDGEWQVLFTRPLATDGGDRTTIPTDGTDVDVALAVWNGSNMEVAGQKSASGWERLAIGPSPPPYERILWAVAGIAIVLTTLVTIEGIRRTRGE